MRPKKRRHITCLVILARRQNDGSLIRVLTFNLAGPRGLECKVALWLPCPWPPRRVNSWLAHSRPAFFAL